MITSKATHPRPLYPIFLDLEDKLVVVAGAGKVALRKTRRLAEAGARIRVIAPRFDGGFAAIPVERIERGYEPGDLAGAVLAFAATDDREVNQRVGADAKALGIPVNIADSPSECSFIVPAETVVDDVRIALSTGGTDPRRAARLRQAIEEIVRGG